MRSINSKHSQRIKKSIPNDGPRDSSRNSQRGLSSTSQSSRKGSRLGSVGKSDSRKKASVHRQINSINFSSSKNSFNLKKMIGPFDKRLSVVERRREIDEQNKLMIKKLVKIKLGVAKYN